MRTIVRAWMVAASIAGIAACERVPEPSPKEATPAATSNAFNVEITLTPAARERLVSQHESLIVSADYFGDPSAQAQAEHVPGSENPG